MTDASVQNAREKSFTFRQKTVSWVAAITLPVIALGNFSEAVMIVESAIDRAISTFTNIPEYKDLGYLRSGINLDFAREIFGMPQVSRNLEQGLSAEYFFDEKYLLTLLVRSGEVMGYTVISLQEGFAPPVFGKWGGNLGEFTFSELKGIPGDFVADWTKNSASYLESVNLGGGSLNQKAFAGWVNYGDGSSVHGLAKLYQSVLQDGDSETIRKTLRGSTKPNFYGWGDLPLSDLTASILSPIDLGHYLSAYQ
ncbi:ETEC_3214 domain-containing protein [Marinobacter piscensis]|uniref:ETEC_3214 domain-containing protein n=1 Tax=Marinobacter piscensis TaxID=1562308 RepID=UPI0011A7F7D4|nr:ETEC_3214 domain-containing protein [Marinobacter piscensis]